MLQEFSIARLIMVEMGTYQDMVLRPYETNVQPMTAQALAESTQGGRRITAASVAGVAGQIIRPAAQGSFVANIANGWNTRRFAFMMEVVFSSFAGGRRHQYITGYTDHADVSMSGYIDPRMRFYINNTIHTNEIQEQTPFGVVTRQRVFEASQLLQGEYVPDLNALGSAMHTMRPEDIFDSLGATVLNAGAYGGGYIDTRQSFAMGRLKKSKRSNANAPTYLANTLSAYQTAVGSPDNDGDQFDQIMGAASDYVKEATIASDPFISHLMSTTSLMEGTSVTYGEMCGMDTTLDGRAQVLLARDPHTTSQLSQRGTTEHWQGAGNETVFCTILSHSVPSVMVDLMLTKVSFMASNKTFDNQFVIQFTGAQSFAEGVDLGPYLDHFRMRLSNEILRDLTQNNLIDIDVTASFDVVRDSYITISIQGNPPITYTIPSFADALSAPVMTNNQQHVGMLGHDISTLSDNLNVTMVAPSQAGFAAPAPNYNTQTSVTPYVNSRSV